VRAASAFVVGDPRSPQTTHGPVANRAQFNRVQEMIGVGIAGARLVCGGPGRPRGLERGCYCPDGLLRVQPQMRIARKNLRPVLVIIAYDSVDEAVEIATARCTAWARSAGRDLATARGGLRIRRAGAHQQPALGPMRPSATSARTAQYSVEGLNTSNQGHPRLREARRPEMTTATQGTTP
jgi:aldehyde dehydrogenase (NAD+)